MVQTKTLLKLLPYLAGVIFAAFALAGFEVSAETAALFDAQPSAIQETADVQVYWFQSKACVVVPPDGYVTNCTYLPIVNVMIALTILFVAVLVLYGLLRKRVNLIPTRRKENQTHG
jgi:hypothetical protein